MTETRLLSWIQKGLFFKFSVLFLFLFGIILMHPAVDLAQNLAHRICQASSQQCRSCVRV